MQFLPAERTHSLNKLSHDGAVRLHSIACSRHQPLHTEQTHSASARIYRLLRQNLTTLFSNKKGDHFNGDVLPCLSLLIIIQYRRHPIHVCIAVRENSTPDAGHRQAVIEYHGHRTVAPASGDDQSRDGSGIVLQRYP